MMKTIPGSGMLRMLLLLTPSVVQGAEARWADPAVLNTAIGSRIERSSGRYDALR